jgi:hypothetical protein
MIAKKNIVCLYAALSLILLFVQPVTDSILYICLYNAAVLANLLNAARVSRKYYHHEAT